MEKSVIRSEGVPRTDRVITHVHLPARSEAVWKSLMFYEDVPRGPWSILRLFVPRPVRSDGDKSRVGGVVHCMYEGGHLIKRITAVEPARLLRFEVLEQQLGIERSFRASEGSYELREVAGGTELVLTTHYHGCLWPRFLWRPLEQYLGHRLHCHILFGMRESLLRESQLLGPGPRARDEASTVAIPRR
jgi:hypothetical protein